MESEERLLSWKNGFGRTVAEFHQDGPGSFVHKFQPDGTETRMALLHARAWRRRSLRMSSFGAFQTISSAGSSVR